MAVGFDLIQAVIGQLESNQSIQTAFGFTYSTFPKKFFADVVDQVDPPYCLIEEGGETYNFMTESSQGGQTETNFTSPGQMLFHIFAPGRGQCRQLGFAIAKSLNDAPLIWPAQNNTMMFRMGRSWFIPMTEPSGPNTAILFCRKFVFDYEYSASLEIFS